MLPGCMGRGTAPTAVPAVQQRGRQPKPLSVLCTPLEPPAAPRAHRGESNGRTTLKTGRGEEKNTSKGEV